MDSPDDVDRICETYDNFGGNWARGTSPLYEDWALGIAHDDAVLRLIAALPRSKQQPNLVFAAARWEGCPLVPFVQARGWFIGNWSLVTATAMARTVQTNEPNRCATWLPLLSRIQGPIALLEVGAAAGLCLFPDRYSCVYATPDGEVRLDPVARASDVVLTCRLDDAASVPLRYPDVAWRRGIDLAPIDPADHDAVAWLANLVWPGPDHDPRVARLYAAARIAAADPAEIVRGDLLQQVGEVAAAAPADATLVVFHSAVLMYLDGAGRRRFADMMAGLGRMLDRPVVWLSNETPDIAADVGVTLPAGLATDHRFIQTRDGIPVALAGQHGATYEVRPFAPGAA